MEHTNNIKPDLICIITTQYHQIIAITIYIFVHSHNSITEEPNGTKLSHSTYHYEKNMNTKGENGRNAQSTHN